MNWKKGVYLVTTVGNGAPQAVIDAIEILQPEEVYFLHTAAPQSSSNVDTILAQTQHPSTGAGHRLRVEAFDAVDIYHKSLGLLEQLKSADPAMICVDITSGTSPMSVGAALAAAKAKAKVTWVQQMGEAQQGQLHYLPMP